MLSDARGLVATLRGGAELRRTGPPGLGRRPVPRTAAISAGCRSAPSSPSCATRSRRCQVGADLRPDRQRRPACTSSRSATSGRAAASRRRGPRAGPPDHRAGAARAPGQPLPARPAPGRLRRRPDLTPTAPPRRPARARQGLRADKRLGQHFLFDPSILRRIAAAAGELARRHGAGGRPGPRRADPRAARRRVPRGWSRSSATRASSQHLRELEARAGGPADGASRPMRWSSTPARSRGGRPAADRRQPALQRRDAAAVRLVRAAGLHRAAWC